MLNEIFIIHDGIDNVVACASSKKIANEILDKHMKDEYKAYCNFHKKHAASIGDTKLMDFDHFKKNENIYIASHTLLHNIPAHI